MGDRLGGLKQLLEEILSTSDIPWWEWDIQSNRVITNDLKTSMLGYALEDFREVDYRIRRATARTRGIWIGGVSWKETKTAIP